MEEKKMKNENGFTLIEMLVVLLIITVLLFIAIPNIVNQSKSIGKKGCDAFVHMVQGQVQAYQIERKTREVPSLSDLISEGYLTEEQKSCPNGEQIMIDSDGMVSAESNAS